MYDQPTRVDGACPERPRGVHADVHTLSHSTDEVLAQDYRLGSSTDDLAAIHGLDPADVRVRLRGVSMQLVDRVLTTVNGPGLWELYPELAEVGEMHDRYCTSCREVVTVDDTLDCPWCETPTQGAGR